MDPNTHSSEWPGGLDRLVAVVDELATENLDALPDAEAAQRVLILRGLIERLEGQWLRELAGVDGRGAAGADQGIPAESTAGWLRHRTRRGHPDAHQRVRVARALHRGPLGGTAKALADGEVSYLHATALTRSTQQLPAATTAAAEPVLLAAARRLDPPGLRKVVGHLCEVADPDAADQRAVQRHERRGLWLAPTFAGMVAVDGLLDPEAGETLLTALEPLARPSTADDERTAAQRHADALTELARRQLEGGRLPQAGGVRPQVTVTIDLAALLGQPGLPGGEGGWVGPLPAATARRLACDATVTRVLVTRHPHQPAGDGDHHPAGERSDGDSAVQAADADPATAGLAARLRAAMGLLPRRWVAPDPNRWRWAAPPGWSPHRNGPRWRCGMGAAGSPLVTGRWPGATPTTCATGSTVAPPTWPTWCCCGVGTIMRSTRAAGGCTATLTASSPLPHRPTDDDHPPHKAAA